MFGEQLELDLFVGVPWGGHSPRGLTRAKNTLFFRPEPDRHEVQPDSAQLELWGVPVKPPRGKRPRQAAGASLLLPVSVAPGIRPGARREVPFWKKEF